MLADHQVLICLLKPANAGALDELRRHYALTDPRVTAIVDRRVGQRRRVEPPPAHVGERRTGRDRRRFAVPRHLASLPEELASRTGPVTWIQRMPPVNADTGALDFGDVVNAVRAGDPVAATELYWRCFQRVHSRLSVLLGNAQEADAVMGRAFGRVLDALDDPEKASDEFDALLYEQVDAVAEEQLAGRTNDDDVPGIGLGIEDPELDEAVRLVDADPLWVSRARTECDRLAQLLGDEVIALEHIGSTAVSGIAARGNLDLMAGTARLPLSPEAMDALETAGYEDCGEAGTPGRLYLRRRGKVRVDLHLVEFDGQLWRDGLAFRDLLRTRPGEAQRWESVKREAARTAPGSASRYYDLRRLTLEELMRLARREAERRAAA
jgi:GrpB-like predicted nucleotidyltransferase (UPF0157 family)